MPSDFGDFVAAIDLFLTGAPGSESPANLRRRAGTMRRELSGVPSPSRSLNRLDHGYLEDVRKAHQALGRRSEVRDLIDEVQEISEGIAVAVASLRRSVQVREQAMLRKHGEAGRETFDDALRNDLERATRMASLLHDTTQSWAMASNSRRELLPRIKSRAIPLAELLDSARTKQIERMKRGLADRTTVDSLSKAVTATSLLYAYSALASAPALEAAPDTPGSNSPDGEHLLPRIPEVELIATLAGDVDRLQAASGSVEEILYAIDRALDLQEIDDVDRSNLGRFRTALRELGAQHPPDPLVLNGPMTAAWTLVNRVNPPLPELRETLRSEGITDATASRLVDAVERLTSAIEAIRADDRGAGWRQPLQEVANLGSIDEIATQPPTPLGSRGRNRKAANTIATLVANITMGIAAGPAAAAVLVAGWSWLAEHLPSAASIIKWALSALARRDI